MNYIILGNILVIFGLAILCLIINLDLLSGLISYFVMSDTLPLFTISSFTIRFEIIAFVPLLLILLIKKHYVIRLDIRRQTNSIIFLIVWILYYCLTTIAMSFFFDTEFMPSRIFAVLRFISLVFLLYLLSDKIDFIKFADKVYLLFFMINLPVLLIQFIFPNSRFLFNAFYAKNHTSAYEDVMRIGFFTKGMGTTYSYTLLGIILSFGVCYYIWKILYYKEKRDVLYLLFGIVDGMLSGSKMFYFSFAIMIFFVLIVYPVLFSGSFHTKQILTIIIWGFIFFLIAFVTLSEIDRLSMFQRIFTDPVSNLGTRYGSDGSVGKALKNYTEEYLIFGYGATEDKGLIGDSMYLVLIHDLGIVGSLCYLIVIVSRMIKGIKKHNMLLFQFAILILLLGIGDPLYFGFCTVIPTFCILFPEKCLKKGDLINE